MRGTAILWGLRRARGTRKFSVGVITNKREGPFTLNPDFVEDAPQLHQRHSSKSEFSTQVFREPKHYRPVPSDEYLYSPSQPSMVG